MKKSLALAAAAVLAVPVMLAPMLVAGPVGAATQNRVVAWVSCDIGAMGMLTVQPVRHVLSCADHNSGLRKLTWSSWTGKAATGAGVYYWNDCTPDCAAGTMHTSKATVELQRPRVQHGEPVFTKVIVRYTDEDGKLQVDAMDALRWQG